MKLIEGQLIHRRYRLDSRLAQGGMGEVWKGYDIQLGREVAIKALRRGGLPTTEQADPVPSRIFAPSGMIATPAEKEVYAEWREAGLDPAPDRGAH